MTAGRLDITAYLQNNKLPTPNAATIMLGDNDLSGANTDAEAMADFTIMLPNLRKLVTALHDAGVTSVGLVLQPPPSSQDGFGANYGTMGNTGAAGNWTQTGVSNAYREKRAMLLWWKAQCGLAREMMLELAQARVPPAADPLLLLGSAAAPGEPAKTVTIVPAGLNLDTVHNMDIALQPANARSDPNDPAQKVVRAENGVHPAQPGQAQIADSLWAWLKFRTSQL
jgi:lysophospholipase L1-like esterase